MTDGTETPEIVTMPERYVVGTAERYTMDTRSQIPAQWQAFFGAGHTIRHSVPGAMYGVSFGMEESGVFRYAVGVEVAGEPETTAEGLCSITLSSGDYAVLSAFGPPATMPQRFDWIFGSWLPSSGHSQREGAVFERYPEDARNGPDGMAYEIWVPITRGA
ncbi:MAG: GyrI-like domain-containing protein [Paracoccaceae bacterium]|nr:GyrI-like domain-containing protein [Paracoccaceae bacterium]